MLGAVPFVHTPSLGTACLTRAQLGTQQIHFHLHLRLNPPSTHHPQPRHPNPPCPRLDPHLTAQSLSSRPAAQVQPKPAPRSSGPSNPFSNYVHRPRTSSSGHSNLYSLDSTATFRRRISSHPHGHHITRTPTIQAHTTLRATDSDCLTEPESDRPRGQPRTPHSVFPHPPRMF